MFFQVLSCNGHDEAFNLNLGDDGASEDESETPRGILLVAHR
jgi:hypothetical protein